MGVIEDIVNDKIVETIITNLGVSPRHKQDLVQEIYLILLQYDRKKIVEMYENKQLNFFLTRVIKNQYYSSTSQFYKLYKKQYELQDENKNNYIGLDADDDDECECVN